MSYLKKIESQSFNKETTVLGKTIIRREGTLTGDLQVFYAKCSAFLSLGRLSGPIHLIRFSKTPKEKGALL